MSLLTPRITPNLWFDTQAKEAAEYYVSIFKNSSLGKISYYGDGAPLPAGTVLTASFTLDGQSFTALNGGPLYRFTEAISFNVNCADQDEVDYYWDKLGAGGDPEAQICGWLKDRFGLSWQIVPTVLSELMSDPDPAKAQRTMAALLKMKKLDIEGLQRAHDGLAEA